VSIIGDFLDEGLPLLLAVGQHPDQQLAELVVDDDEQAEGDGQDSMMDEL
jgi:hypothetical protein